MNTSKKMFSEVFISKVFLSFITGGLFTAITLYAADRYGPKAGGIIAGLPSTTAVGLFFIGYTQSPEAASRASSLMPAAVAGSLIFAAVYASLCRKTGYPAALITASAIWFCISLPLAYYGFEDINTATAFFILVWITVVYAMRRHQPEAETPKEARYTAVQKIERAAFSGCVIAFAVVASSMMGPLWGGVFAAFPAMFLSSFLILARSYGCKYSSEFARNTPLGLLGVIPYLWGVHCFYSSHGIIWGTLTAYAFSLSVTYAVYSLTEALKKRHHTDAFPEKYPLSDRCDSDSPENT